MEKGVKSQNLIHKKKFCSPLRGKRQHKASFLPKIGVNFSELDKPSPKTKHGARKIRSKLQFQMGGDSTDPLNLNSLIDRDPSEVTPQCSPYRVKELSPQVVVARDVTDPLNLKCDLKGIVVVTPVKKKRKRKRNDSSSFDDEQENQNKKEMDDSKEDVLPKIKKKRQHAKEIKIKEKKKNLKEKTKSEQVSNGHSETKRTEDTSQTEEKNYEGLNKNHEVSADVEEFSSKEHSIKEKETSALSNSFQEPNPGPTKSTQNFASGKPKHRKTFLYGNYNRYYGYRNPNVPDDPRLKLFQRDWFKDKTVLDLGCNIGNVTLQVARDFSPQHVLGIDIDSSLIRAANKYLRCAIQEDINKKPALSNDFPMSFMVCRGPIVSRTSPTEGRTGFPYNVQFKEENFVLQSDKGLAKQKPTYDVILCLSLTKWIHLNWGDEGLKRTFQRMFLMLNPGGRLLLEAQPFNSYSRRKNLSEKIRRNYDSIKFKPNQFVDYLMSEEVGFASYEALGVAENNSKGFQRPIYVFTKSVSGESYDALGVNIAKNRKNFAIGSQTNDNY